MRRAWRSSLLGLALAATFLGGCTKVTMQEFADSRLVRAENELRLCKDEFGLANVPTPTNPALYDTAAGPTAQDAAQLRLKTVCGRQLRELLDAQRAKKELGQ
jgi:hypothetical protein